MAKSRFSFERTLGIRMDSRLQERFANAKAAYEKMLPDSMAGQTISDEHFLRMLVIQGTNDILAPIERMKKAAGIE